MRPATLAGVSGRGFARYEPGEPFGTLTGVFECDLVTGMPVLFPAVGNRVQYEGVISHPGGEVVKAVEVTFFENSAR